MFPDLVVAPGGLLFGLLHSSLFVGLLFNRPVVFHHLNLLLLYLDLRARVAFVLSDLFDEALVENRLDD